MKPSAFGRPFARALPLVAGIAALMVALAYGGASEAPTPAAAATPAAQQQQRSAPQALAAPAAQPANTPIPQAMAATKDWDPLDPPSLTGVIPYSQLYNQIVQFDAVDTAAIATMSRYANPCHGTGRYGLRRNYTVKMGVVGKYVGNCASANQDAGLWAIARGPDAEFNPQFAPGAFIKFLAIDYANARPGHPGENVTDRGATSGPLILATCRMADRC